jgi:transposase InsO family protein
MEAMDQKIQLIADWKARCFSIIDLSNKYHVSRPTVYKWVGRYEELGLDGLKEQSRAPLHNPHRTPEHIISLIVQEKLKNRSRGPKKVYAQLERHYPDIDVPSPSTIGEILKRHGLVHKRKRRFKVPPYTEPFKACEAPNTVWSADYKGQFYTWGAHICYPLTISDNYSRYLLACQGLAGPRYAQTRTVFEKVFKEYGLPDAIRVDNGTPFTGKCPGGLSRLSVWWIQLGITPERIDKGCPQQNGRHERMHRTLKEEAVDPFRCTMQEQQKHFDLFRMEYNNDRPHEALDQNAPNSYYRKSTKPYTEKRVKPEYDRGYIVRHVLHSGEITFRGTMYSITRLLTGEPIGLKEIADGQWKVFYSFHPLGILDERRKKLIK